MPRTYRRQTEKASWTWEQLRAAIAAVKGGKKVREVARIFNIPRSSLQNRLKENSEKGPSLGRRSVFSPEEEKELAKHVIHLSKLFYEISRQEIKKCAYDYAEKNNKPFPFNKDKKTAGDDWLWGLMKRNPSVALRKPESTSINRITAFNKEEVTVFFNNLEQVQTKYNFKAHRIFNTDETGISTVQTPGKILAQKGLKQVGFATSWERGRNITVVCAFSASGIFVPPMFIYGRKRMNPQLQKGGPPGVLYTCSDKGWITEDLFVQYLNHFQHFTKASLEDPVLLIMDNHSTHSTLQAYEFCKSNGIILLSIPPHTSHKIQPLDVTFYGPLKIGFNTECNKYLKNHPHEKITPFEVSELFNNAFMRVATPEKAIKGFQVTGIFPYNPDVFSEEDFEPARLHNISLNNVSDLEKQEQQTPERQQTPKLQEPPEPPRTPPHQKSSELQLLTPQKKMERSFQELLPLPGPSTSKIAKKSTTNKQHSQIITSTPYKDVLEKKAAKKLSKQALGKESYKRKIIEQNAPGVVKRSKLRGKKKVYKDMSSGEEDNDDEEKDEDVKGDDICLLCGVFGKNGEMWLRCILCGHWAHRACANTEKKLFKCDFCV